MNGDCGFYLFTWMFKTTNGYHTFIDFIIQPRWDIWRAKFAWRSLCYSDSDQSNRFIKTTISYLSKSFHVHNINITANYGNFLAISVNKTFFGLEISLIIILQTPKLRFDLPINSDSTHYFRCEPSFRAQLYLKIGAVPMKFKPFFEIQSTNRRCANIDYSLPFYDLSHNGNQFWIQISGDHLYLPVKNCINCILEMHESLIVSFIAHIHQFAKSTKWQKHPNYRANRLVFIAIWHYWFSCRCILYKTAVHIEITMIIFDMRACNLYNCI